MWYAKKHYAEDLIETQDVAKVQELVDTMIALKAENKKLVQALIAVNVRDDKRYTMGQIGDVTVVNDFDDCEVFFKSEHGYYSTYVVEKRGLMNLLQLAANTKKNSAQNT